MQLIHSNTKEPAHVGDALTTFRGEPVTLVGSQEPRHSGSTGRIIVQDADGHANSFYPGVCGLEWQK